jgi:hypothetical protein
MRGWALCCSLLWLVHQPQRSTFWPATSSAAASRGWLGGAALEGQAGFGSTLRRPHRRSLCSCIPPLPPLRWCRPPPA